MQALRSNEQMAVAMKGATRAMGQMNKSLNLPQIQRIMNEFEKESQTMDMKEEMMGDAVDDVMDDEAEGEGEEEEGDKILKEVLDEIGISTQQMVSLVDCSRECMGVCVMNGATHFITMWTCDTAWGNTVDEPTLDIDDCRPSTCRRRGFAWSGWCCRYRSIVWVSGR